MTNILITSPLMGWEDMTQGLGSPRQSLSLLPTCLPSLHTSALRMSYGWVPLPCCCWRCCCRSSLASESSLFGLPRNRPDFQIQTATGKASSLMDWEANLGSQPLQYRTATVGLTRPQHVSQSSKPCFDGYSFYQFYSNRKPWLI